ncbi:MAG: rod shape-determining protein MreD [Cellulophaga sp.]
MLNNRSFLIIARFILLALTQVLVFNRLNFFGFINPMVYILFLYWYPIKQNRTIFIAISFLFGLTLDLFSDTLAIHTAATITIAYLRPTIMRFCFGVNYEFQSFKLSSATKAQQITFLTLLIVVHHIIFFSLEVFNFSSILLVLKKILSTGATTFVICMLFSSLFSVNKK